MTFNPKVSIGMPVYNGEPYLINALNSLLDQTFSDFELIISDNNSTDNTGLVCQEYAKKDKRIKYIRQSVNQGAIANFEFVLDKACGDLFMWAAADDVWSREFIEECYGLLIETAQAGMAMTGYDIPSTISWVLNRKLSNAPLSCIQEKEKTDRLKAYTSMSYTKSHKDNLVYALWRREVIKSVIADLARIFNGNPIIGGAMNEYALALFQGVYSPKILFHKRYKFPPGHPLTTLISKMLKVYRKFNKTHQSLNYIDMAEKHLNDVLKVLEFLEFDTSFIDELSLLHNTK